MIKIDFDFLKNLPDISLMTKEERREEYLKNLKILEEDLRIQNDRMYHPELINGWINRDGDFIKLDKLDHHELWGMEYLSGILKIDKWKVQSYVREKFDRGLLDYFCNIGWVKITQWEKQNSPSAVHCLPMNEMQEITVERIKEQYNLELRLLYIPDRFK